MRISSTTFMEAVVSDDIISSMAVVEAVVDVDVDVFHRHRDY